MTDKSIATRAAEAGESSAADSLSQDLQRVRLRSPSDTQTLARRHTKNPTRLSAGGSRQAQTPQELPAFTFNTDNLLNPPSQAGSSPPKNLDGPFILRNATVCAPKNLGRCDIVVAGGKIVAIHDATDAFTMGFKLQPFQALCPTTTVIDCTDCFITPGLIDPHVHVTGGGGELGPASRTPPAALSEIIRSGVTTLVGCLGTDTVTRSPEDLIATTRALTKGGLTAYAWLGGYRVPVRTLTGSIVKDLVCVEQIIGVGELAISDHRGSAPTREQLIEIASDARVGGMLAGKAGTVHVHVGSDVAALSALWDVVDTSPLPMSSFYPTHISSRGDKTLKDAIEWVRQGGVIDMTADDVDIANGGDKGKDYHTLKALQRCKAEKVDLSCVTISSDAYGSFPVFSEDGGELLQYAVGKQRCLLRTLFALTNDYGWSMEDAFALCTRNTANFLKFAPRKGQIAVGADADLLVFKSARYEDLLHVFANGQCLKYHEWVQKGMFEP
ncbi:hypothetical protein RI367_002255 [Sorochytrium milnesiophthora]